MNKILIIGHSHIVALKKAKTLNETFDFFQLRDKELDLDKVSKYANKNYDSVILLVGGNTYNVFGLVNHPEAFDFYLTENPDLPINSDAYLIPERLVTTILERKLTTHINTIEKLREYFNQPILHVESPPPIPSSTHIETYPSVFKEKIHEFGISPAMLRYKLWRIQSKIVSKNCEKLNITFLNCPIVTQDAQGCLLEKYWALDPTHANGSYGDLVLNQIRTIHNFETQQMI